MSHVNRGSPHLRGSWATLHAGQAPPPPTSPPPAAEIDRIVTRVLESNATYVETFRNLVAEETKDIQQFDKSGRVNKRAAGSSPTCCIVIEPAARRTGAGRHPARHARNIARARTAGHRPREPALRPRLQDHRRDDHQGHRGAGVPITLSRRMGRSRTGGRTRRVRARLPGTNVDDRDVAVYCELRSHGDRHARAALGGRDDLPAAGAIGSSCWR